MQLAILVTAAPGTPMGDHALPFCQAAASQGHHIVRIFFYGEGVYHASGLRTPPQDERDDLPGWKILADQGIELCVCIAAALRRGVLSREEAERHQRLGHSLAPGFVLGGLGLLAEAYQLSNHRLHFGQP
ncbi:MAG: sulfurtransferase complex subunit TusD [Pseudomonadales bacterium]|nr:sulfurtransferase complex subunit TusD [Pseudomonadales bacterium]